MATFSELLASLDQSPQVRGRQFERICQWYLRHDPLYRAQLEDVWLWDEWSEREGRDLGIDLVARTRDGKLWAVQAKAYDPEKTLRKSDVDSVLAKSARSDFAFRLILTTARDLSGNLRKQFTQVEPPISAKVLCDLESADLFWPESPDKLRAPKPERKSPTCKRKLVSRRVGCRHPHPR
jgi:predicted helicase